MKKIAIFITALALFASCDKPYKMDLPLSVAQRNISLSKDAGSTHVLVYADGDWTATFTEPVDWASLNKVSGYGNSDLVFPTVPTTALREEWESSCPRTSSATLS